MALTRDSALFYWDAQHGLQPIVGGDPVYSRDSAGSFRALGRVGRNVIVGLPRFGVADLGDGMGDRPVLDLQLARTNRVAYSEDIVGKWTAKGTPLVTTGHHDPFGGSAGTLITDDDGGVLEARLTSIPFSGDGVKAISVFVRQAASSAPSGSNIFLYDATADAQRLNAVLTWPGGVPSLAMSVGTFLHAEEWVRGWWRLLFRSTAVTAANTNEIYLRPAAVVAETGGLYVFGAQGEDGEYPTSYIRTAGAAALRAADLLRCRNAPAPQKMAVYVRLRESDVRSFGSGGRIFEFGSGGNPRFLCYRSDPGVYRAYYETASGTVTSSVDLSPSPGDTIELLAVLHGDGVKLFGSLKGAAVISGAGSSPLALVAAFSSEEIHVNSVGASQVGAGGYADLRVVKYADMTNPPLTAPQDAMDEIRDFVLDRAGNLI
jgi:hypothetical protein